jgi:hypothetical protein
VGPFPRSANPTPERRAMSSNAVSYACELRVGGRRVARLTHLGWSELVLALAPAAELDQGPFVLGLRLAR